MCTVSFAQYLVKRNALDPRLCLHAQDRMWAFAPQDGRLQRHDPSSWVGPFPQGDEEEHPSNRRGGYTWKLRAPGETPKRPSARW